MWPLGLFPLRSGGDIEHIVVHGKQVDLRFPEGERSAQQWKLNHLWVDDPYGLRTLVRHRGEIQKIVDIGGNIGFFSIMARHYFREAIIHCYEPNPALAPIIGHNLSLMDVRLHHEGAGLTEGHADLTGSGNTLCGTLQPADAGGISITPIAEIVDRMEGRIDLAKIDCEGAEWDIFEDRDSLKRIKFLALEYHLELRPGKSVAGLVKLLGEAGFHIDALREADNPAVGQLRATNRSLLK